MIISCDWGTTKNKSTKISELSEKIEGEAENQEGKDLVENFMPKNGIPIIDTGTVNLGGLNMNFLNNQPKVDKPIIPNKEAITSKIKVEAEPMVNNINVTAIIPKPDKNLENSSSNTTIGAEILPIKNQKELSKKTLPSK